MKSSFPFNRHLCASAIGAALAVTATPGFAQLEEVIVTAQKRAESAQDVPIAITAFDAGDLVAKQISGFADMRFTAPSVSYSKTNFSGNNFKIRGIGSDLIAASSDAGVGVHVNEVPLRSPRLFETEYYDIEQISILRGPQGTLYGRNSTGGAIDMRTARPDTESMFGNIEAQYGNFDNQKVVGHINIPVSDTLAVRLAGIWLEREGYTDNIYTGNDVDGRDQYSLRGSLRWEPSENTSVDLMVSYFEEDSSRSRSQKTLCDYDASGVLGCLPNSLDYDQPNGAAQLATIFASTEVLGPLGLFSIFDSPVYTTPNDLRKVSSERDPAYKSDETLVTLEINHDVGDYTLTFVGGYQDTGVWSQMDYQWQVADPVAMNPLLPFVIPNTYNALFSDGTFPLSAPNNKNPTGIIGGHIEEYVQGIEAFDQANAYDEQYSGEIRIRSNFDGPFNFVLGAFYMEAENETDYWVIATGLDYFGAVLPGAAYGLDGFGFVSPAFNSETNEYTVDSTAFFGEIYYDLTESLKLTVGLRYTEDEKFVSSRAPLYAGGFQPIGADLPVELPYDEFEDKWEEWTGRIVLDYALNDDTMLFGSYSRGYKGGGFNPAFKAAEFPNQSTTFEPEFIDAFEIGMKSSLLDNTLRANLTAFFYDYSDLQVSKIINRTSFNENTDAEIYGAEAEFMFAPDAHWLLNANFSYLNSSLKDFKSIDARDPSGGRDPLFNDNVAFEDQVTTLKSLANASSCVVPLAPAIWDTFGAGVGPANRHSDCGAIAAAGIPVIDGVELDLDGNQLSNTPEFSVSLGAQYTFDLGDSGDLAVRLDYYWQDEMYARLYNKEVDKVDSWDVWNAQATYTSRDETWYARAYIKNIMDDDNVVGHYFTDASSGNFTNVFLIEPQTYGIALGYNF